MKVNSKNLIIDEKKLYFILFALHIIAEKYKISPKKVYKILNKTDIVDKYFIECFDVTHAMGKLAIIDDVEEYLSNRGVKIC